MKEQIRIDDRISGVDPRGRRWTCFSLEWWVSASTGVDQHGCFVVAWIDEDRLQVQHGENPEAVRWFSLDELNDEIARVGDDMWNDVTQH